MTTTETSDYMTTVTAERALSWIWGFSTGLFVGTAAGIWYTFIWLLQNP